MCLRKTSPAARKSVFPLIQEIISAWCLTPLIKKNITDMSFTFPDGSSIFCGGLDDENKLKSIQGLTGIFLEECNDFKQADYVQANLRLRGCFEDYFQILLAFNPVSKRNWVYRYFYTQEQPDTTYHTSTYIDNKWIDDNYKKTLLALKEQDPSFYKIFCLGEWGETRQNIIYNKYNIINDLPCDIEGYGIDFGFDTTALVGISKIENDIYLHEIGYWHKKTNSDIIKLLNDLNIPKNKVIIADSAEPDRILEIKRAGFQIKKANKNKGSVLNGIDFVLRHNLHITEGSTTLLDEIGNYAWALDKNNISKDEPVKFKDHLMDALRYYIYTIYYKQKNKLRVFEL